MNERLSVLSQGGEVELRAIEASDQEELRRWKNANRFAFFFQDVISREQQDEWFRGYLDRPNDFMFVVLVAETRIGCMGFRLLEQKADIYNVIRWEESIGKGRMGTALRLMCSLIRAHCTSDIGAKVLKDNPAVHWYCRNGFKIESVQESHYEVRLSQAEFRPDPFRLIGRLPPDSAMERSAT